MFNRWMSLLILLRLILLLLILDKRDSCHFQTGADPEKNSGEGGWKNLIFITRHVYVNVIG